MQKYSPAVLKIESFKDLRLFALASIFTVANVLTPIIIHRFIPAGGQMFLPLYFFSLLAGLMYGWRVGVVTGLASPVLSFLLTGMPPVMILGFVLLKSSILGFSSGIFSKRLTKFWPYLPAVFAVALTQAIGIVAIMAFTNKSGLALSDILTGYPGLILQIVMAPLATQYFFRDEKDKA